MSEAGSAWGTGRIFSIIARWASCALTVPIALGAMTLGYFTLLTGAVNGLFWFAVATAFVAPAGIAMWTGRMRYLRWLWGGASAICLLGCTQALMEGGLASGVLLIYSLTGLALSLLAKETRPDEEMDLIEPFS